MKVSLFKSQAALLLLVSWFLSPCAFAASPSPAVQKAKQDAEAKGYMFLTNRDEIVANAKREGKLRVLAELEPPNIKAATAAFKKVYPFIDLYIEEIQGTEQVQRALLELQSGAAKDWDVLYVPTDFNREFRPYILKMDILGMAEQKILQIPLPMIDQKNRNSVALLSRFQTTAYNKNLIPADRVPRTWEDLLKPEFKGKKFAADIRPTEIACLVPAWGLEKTVDFARRLAAQQPIWVRGGSRTITAITAGEVPMMIGPNFTAVKRAQAKDRTGVLQYVNLEPVPIRLAVEEGIHKISQRPNAALLWLEWMTGQEAQKLADELEPLASSVHVRGGAVEQELRGKKLSVVSWDQYQSVEQWQNQVFEAYGFPKVDR